MPNSMGQRLDARAQLATASTLVMTMFLPNFPSIRLMNSVYRGPGVTSILGGVGAPSVKRTAPHGHSAGAGGSGFAGPVGDGTPLLLDDQPGPVRGERQVRAEARPRLAEQPSAGGYGPRPE